MLVLSRKRGERVRIGDNIEVVVLAISGSRVKLGFSGPPDIWIRRDELEVGQRASTVSQAKSTDNAKVQSGRQADAP